MKNHARPHTLLYEALASYFDLEELKSLCYDLRVEYENLPGEQTRIGRARELVRLLERQKRLGDLLVRAAALRPQVEWQAYLPAEPEATSPYKGLLHFDEADTPLFFGRGHVKADAFPPTGQGTAVHTRRYPVLIIGLVIVGLAVIPFFLWFSSKGQTNDSTPLPITPLTTNLTTAVPIGEIALREP